MSAKIINCKECGRLFSALPSMKICERCRAEHEKDFKIVRDYLYENPTANIKGVEEDTEVSHEAIMQFLRDGRLQFKGDNMLLNCERCDKPIATGRYCDACTADMAKALGAAGKQMEKHINEGHPVQGNKTFHMKKNKKL